MGKMIKIYDRFYDKDTNPDGSVRPKKFLGEFEKLEQVDEDSYDEKFIGVMNGDVYLVVGSEVSGIGGGMRYEVKKLKSLMRKA